MYRVAGPRAPELLASCYKSCAALALANSLSKIAFPAISCGVYGYPLEEAADVAIASLSSACEAGDRHLSEVHFVLFGQESFDAWINGVAKAGLDAIP